MSEDLKPVRCGCGGEAEIGQKYLMGNLPDVYVICGNCSIRTGEYYTEAEAVEAWNTAMGERTAKVTLLTPDSKGYWSTNGRCQGCGFLLERKHAYCPNCGARLEWK